MQCQTKYDRLITFPWCFMVHNKLCGASGKGKVSVGCILPTSPPPTSPHPCFIKSKWRRRGPTGQHSCFNGLDFGAILPESHTAKRLNNDIRSARHENYIDFDGFVVVAAHLFSFEAFEAELGGSDLFMELITDRDIRFGVDIFRLTNGIF